MSNDPSLFDFAHTHARRIDPETSHAAAISAEPLAKRHAATILAFLKRIYPLDATADDIASGTKLLRHAVLKRLPDLKEAGQAELTGETRIMRTGRRGRTWRAK